MGPANRNRKLVADFASHRARLGKAQMMGVGRRPAADQTRLPRYELAVFFVAKADGLGRQVAKFGEGLFGGLRHFCVIAVRSTPAPSRPSHDGPLPRLIRTIAEHRKFRFEAGDHRCRVRHGQ
jgi:hypothetical protein